MKGLSSDMNIHQKSGLVMVIHALARTKKGLVSGKHVWENMY